MTYRDEDFAFNDADRKRLAEHEAQTRGKRFVGQPRHREERRS